MIRAKRPKVELLSRTFIEKIIGEALLLLERQAYLSRTRKPARFSSWRE